ncbi:MAG TPA: aldehyde dehydrogenase family protein, partial [Chitinophagaceae bacterium]|nr:aldehyde dehydrogenase family protein [Chitinophagaceae bacterium]
MSLINELENLRNYFERGATLSADFRIEQLKKLKQSILEYEYELYQALYTDLKKNKEETWVTETGMVISELNTALRKIKSWMRPEKVRTNLLNLPSSSRILRE